MTGFKNVRCSVHWHKVTIALKVAQKSDFILETFKDVLFVNWLRQANLALRIAISFQTNGQQKRQNEKNHRFMIQKFSGYFNNCNHFCID